MSLSSRVEKIETELTPPGVVKVTDWFERCESKQAALARLGKLGPDDIAILCATWQPCTRRGRHRHDDEPVIVHPRR